MQTIHLKVNEKVYKHLMWFLKKFSKDELQIIEENPDFLTIQKEVQANLQELENGNAEFISIETLDKSLDETIKRYEN